MSTETKRVKPLFLITPGAMKPRDLRRIENECGVVIAECKAPESVRLVEPPIDADMDAQARAALALARMLVFHDSSINTTFNRGDLIRFFTNALMAYPQPKVIQKAKR